MLLIFFDVVDLDVPTNTTYFCLNQCYFFLSEKQLLQEVGRRKWASTYIQVVLIKVFKFQFSYAQGCETCKCKAAYSVANLT